MYECMNLRIYESTNLGIYESTNLRNYASTNLRIYESTNSRIFEFVFHCVGDHMLPGFCCRVWARVCVGWRRVAGIKVPPIVLNHGGRGYARGANTRQGCEHARDVSTPGASRSDTISEKTEILTLTQPRSDPSTELG